MKPVEPGDEPVGGATALADPEVDSLAAARPLHLRARYLYVVFVGGVLGTTARWCLAEWMPAVDGWPLGTLVANLVGAFCLGLLLEVLLRTAPDQGWPRLARLHLGTGFLGSFTTMSALVTETTLLAQGHHPGQAAGYLVGSLLGGVVLAWLGVVLGARLAGEAAR
ncbi:CrcB family protein [Luteococcus peritonei]|uniref:Fluoride-specific ion channel FluC n=1 Tax=Luteococcus peritonei TaxID=88874 RepID=A0ABW4RUU4_9ACTN